MQGERIMIKKLFEKHEALVVFGSLILYLGINFAGGGELYTTNPRGPIVNTLISILLLVLIIGGGRTAYYGLRKPQNAKQLLYFLPLALLPLTNLISGITVRSAPVILCHILLMLNVGFCEEIIFRGFLFRYMAKDNLKSAIIVSALTFGIGHIGNLMNGAPVGSTLMQVCYAIGVGFLMVFIFIRSGSLLPCIICHQAINSTSVFGKDFDNSMLGSIFMIVVEVVYILYILKKTDKNMLSQKS